MTKICLLCICISNAYIYQRQHMNKLMLFTGEMVDISFCRRLPGCRVCINGGRLMSSWWTTRCTVSLLLTKNLKYNLSKSLKLILLIRLLYFIFYKSFIHTYVPFLKFRVLNLIKAFDVGLNNPTLRYTHICQHLAASDRRANMSDWYLEDKLLSYIHGMGWTELGKN